MISNLPLLFADGYPTCLDKITVGQLEKFVPFMVQCSNGSNPVNSTVPEWWPDNLEFSLPVMKPSGVDSKWSTILKSLVSRCYSYHGCDFMLRFSEALSQCPVSSLRFVDGHDGTTSLYSKVTGKLLVTFRNENMLYDKKRESPKKTLLSRRYEEPEPSHLMVQPPLFDIYLCENCDGEFSSLKEMQCHENTCHLVQQNSPLSSSVVDDLNSDQDKFLNYFCLSNVVSTNEAKAAHKKDPINFRKTVGGSWRYAGIPFSSPLGHLVHRKIQVPHSMKIERNCHAKPSDYNAQFCRRRSPSWIVTWKPPDKSETLVDNWVHIYKYPKEKSWKRSFTSQILPRNKNQKLHEQCQNVKVKLKRLTQREIDLYTSPSRTTLSPSIVTSISGTCQNEVNNLKSETYDLERILPNLLVNKGNYSNHEMLTNKDEILENSISSNFPVELQNNEQINSEPQLGTFRIVQTSPKVSENCIPVRNKSVEVSSKKTYWMDEIEAIPVISLISSDEEGENF